MKLSGRMMSLVAIHLTLSLSAAEGTRADCLVTEAETTAWLDQMQQPRFTGNSDHQEFINYIWEQLSAVTASGATALRQSQSFKLWEAGDPSLELEDGNGGWAPVDRVAGYVPYTALTDGVDGVEGEVVYKGKWKKWDQFNAQEHGGKIVVIKLRPPALPGFVALMAAKCFPWFMWDVLTHRRAVALESLMPSLKQAHAVGVKGVVAILDLKPPVAQRQYVPFTRPLQPIPALYVDREIGTQLKSAAAAGRKVRLRLPGTLSDVSTDHLIATLPGASDEVILINTHTDGPNVIEENGPLALWALYKHFAGLSTRPRTLVFVFATGHFAHDVGSTDDFIHRNQPIIDKTRAAITIEHLGALEWSGSKPEPALFFLTKYDPSLNRLVKEVVASRKLKRVALMRPGLFLFGEGQFLESVQVPTVGYLTDPKYLLSYETDHRTRFSRERMCHELDVFRELIEGAMSLP